MFFSRCTTFLAVDLSSLTSPTWSRHLSKPLIKEPVINRTTTLRDFALCSCCVAALSCHLSKPSTRCLFTSRSTTLHALTRRWVASSAFACHLSKASVVERSDNRAMARLHLLEAAFWFRAFVHQAIKVAHRHRFMNLLALLRRRLSRRLASLVASAQH
jgi:hypothetical protein